MNNLFSFDLWHNFIKKLYFRTSSWKFSFKNTLFRKNFVDKIKQTTLSLRFSWKKKKKKTGIKLSSSEVTSFRANAFKDANFYLSRFSAARSSHCLNSKPTDWRLMKCIPQNSPNLSNKASYLFFVMFLRVSVRFVNFHFLFYIFCISLSR